jgi:hypothetical protein
MGGDSIPIEPKFHFWKSFTSVAPSDRAATRRLNNSPNPVLDHCPLKVVQRIGMTEAESKTGEFRDGRSIDYI